MGLFFYKTTTAFSYSNYNCNILFKGIGLLALAESMYCFGQYFGIISSLSTYFAVTGTWANPNVTALFLALTVPAFLYLFETSVKKQAKIGFVLILLALVLLQCRTAYIGVAIQVIVYYGFKYQFVHWLKDKKNRVGIKALLIFGLLLIIPITTKLYHAKKASADGRAFIWKVATQMATNKPITGHGYGYFSSHYNAFQSQYIQDGKASIDELQNVAAISMPHNEILQQLVEGGSVGLVLMLFFFGSLLFCTKKPIENSNSTAEKPIPVLQSNLYALSYAAVVGYIVMSMFNTTLIVAPVMALVLIYAAILTTKQNSIKTIAVKPNNSLKFLFTILTIATSVFVMYVTVPMAIADRQNKIAFALTTQGNYTEALKLLQKLEPSLRQDSDYWNNIAGVYYKLQNYPATIIALNKATALTTDYSFYLGLAKSYHKLGQYPQAIAQYQKLILLKPSKFSYRFELMKIYVMQKDSLNALKTAQGIIDLKPKIPSKKVVYYKKMAKKTRFYYEKLPNKKTIIPKTKLTPQQSNYSFLNPESK
ncbi:O-antigen ligase family protein [Flavobacterium faecale]|uniref:O-antigen ligase family protein n=1 Tax=Flavobacterium faecale TaxID=1355330 RepID=UPI003AAA4286